MKLDPEKKKKKDTGYNQGATWLKNDRGLGVPDSLLINF